MAAGTSLVHMASATGSTYSSEPRVGMMVTPIEPLTVAEREEAIAKVKKEVPVGTFSFKMEKEVALPTQAIYVDSVLGKCSACELYV